MKFTSLVVLFSFIAITWAAPAPSKNTIFARSDANAKLVPGTLPRRTEVGGDIDVPTFESSDGPNEVF
ncbi:hypothetical protein K438DRAFT_1974879 [Mycena galopus ATCC 62051]|nr:hypothetical protein K438DRAFT_1974879 [Mycena galopus ATCC 62051]